MDHEKLAELKRKRAVYVDFGATDKVKAIDERIARLRGKADQAPDEEPDPPVEAAVEPPDTEKAVRDHPARRPRKG
jgi:hypothetical protein